MDSTWWKDLGIRNLKLYHKIGYLQKSRTKISSYQISNIALHLTALKILDPCSHLHAFNAQYLFLGNLIEGICLDNIYAALNFLGTYKDEIMQYAAKRTLSSRHKPVMLFYDVTNCYFETPYDDREQFVRKFKRNLFKKIQLQSGKEAAWQFLASPQFETMLAEALTKNEHRMLRLRGLSKEKRYDLPLVSVALVIDERGMPLDFQVYKGNKSEYATMVHSIRALKQRYKVPDVHLVTACGLNSVANLNLLLQEGLGLVMTQRVTLKLKS